MQGGCRRPGRLHDGRSRDSIESDAFRHGYDGKLSELEEIYSNNKGDYKKCRFVVDMALMGSVAGKRKNTGEWALNNGACLLWLLASLT